jgi:hypothetical protein
MILRVNEAALESLDVDAGVIFATATVIEKGVEVESNFDAIESVFNRCLRILRHTIESKQDVDIVSSSIRLLSTLLALSSKPLYTLIETDILN